MGFYFGEDSSGGGSIVDFASTWPLVENLFYYDANLEIKFPLHYYIASLIYYIVGDKEILRLIYVSITIFVPLLFYRCLREKYNHIDINNLFLFSLVLLLLPAVRTSAIWPNTQITGIFFFLISLLFFLKWENEKNYLKISKNLIFTLLFMSLTVYTRQIYAIIFMYFVWIFFQRFNLKIFLKICFLISIFSVPGFVYIILYPKILAATFDSSLNNSVLVNSSMICFYLMPIYLISFLIGNNEKFEFNYKNLVVIVMLLILTIILSSFFNYNYKMGGGLILKVSLFFFSNFYIFFLSSFLGFLTIYYLSKNSFNNLVLSLLIIFGISAIIIFHKYFEPMMILLFFLIYKTEISRKFLENKKKIILYLFFIFFYLIAALINDYYNLNLTL
tara:strand:+ start:309 stop:1475 length:1167 start_codon:yes stop_codon:yes gene_type:complete